MYQTFAEVKSALSSGKSVLDVVEYYLTNIEKQTELNAFLEVFEKSVREQAIRVDEKIREGSIVKMLKEI